MKSRILLLACLIGFAFSCTFMEDEESDSDLMIRTGTICGWGSVNDTLILTGDRTVRYVNYTRASAGKPLVEKKAELSPSELESLMALLNVKELKKLELNSCNVCFDGCDDWISFTDGTASHYIRFTKDDPKLQPIKAFVDQLNVLKAKYSAN